MLLGHGRVDGWKVAVCGAGSAYTSSPRTHVSNGSTDSRANEACLHLDMFGSAFSSCAHSVAVKRSRYSMFGSLRL